MRNWFRTAILAGILFCAIWYYHIWEHWESHATGSYNCPPTGCPGGVAHNYNFFSGWGSDWIPSVITVFGLMLGYWWHNRCQVSGCLWLSRPHPTAAGNKACFVHHPESKLTKVMMHARHHDALKVQGTLDEIHRHVQELSPNAGLFRAPNSPVEAPGDPESGVTK
jgi:hypothetical protein